jgi:hypothetical protein
MPKENADWIKDELILALDLYLRNPESPHGKSSREVRELSTVLVSLGGSLAFGGAPNFAIRTASTWRLLDILLERNHHLSRIYLSWDAASWYISKRLSERIASNNVMAHVMGSTRVEVAPLPAGAQFLNAIEPIFSGMARAVIHNSDYKSTDDAKAAIDRYFEEAMNTFA